MTKENLSRNDHKYHAGEIVMWPSLTYGIRPVLINKASWDAHIGQHFYVCTMDGHAEYSPFYEHKLRPMTFREFASFTHPVTGRWMVGKTRGYMAAIIHALGLLFIALGVVDAVQGYFDALIGSGIGAFMLGGFWLGTYANYRKWWV